MTPGSAGSERRQARSIRNDGRILDAAYRILSERGWSDLTFPPVAHLAGLSLRPVRDRFADRSELAAAAWSSRVYPELVGDLIRLQDASDLAIKSGEAEGLIDALGPFHRPEPRMRAAIEVIIVAGFDPILRGALDATVLPHLRGWLTPRLDGLSPADAARRAYLASIALGMAVSGLQFGPDQPRLDDEIRRLATILGMPREPLTQPSATADHVDVGTDFGTGDPDWDDLLQATLDQVGTRGYDAATTAAIARASGHTEGFLFARYASKIDLFFDATQRMVGRNTKANLEFQAQVAQLSSAGMSEAVIMREFMRPGREQLRLINLEQYRVSWHDERFQRMMNQVLEPFMDAFAASMPQASPTQARAGAVMELVRGVGPVVLSHLLPETWTLPYDVVTIPLLDSPG